MINLCLLLVFLPNILVDSMAELAPFIINGKEFMTSTDNLSCSSSVFFKPQP